MRTKLLLISSLFSIVMATPKKPIYEEMKVEMVLDEEGGLPETMVVVVPVTVGEAITLSLTKKQDEFKDVMVILGSDGEDTRWEPHHGEKFHVYSDHNYHASFSVAINQTESSNKLSLYGSYIHDGRYYSIRPDDEDFDKSALELEPLHEMHVSFKGHQHSVTQDKPPTRDHIRARDFIRPDEL